MQILAPIAATAPVHANRILAYGRAFFSWALERRLVDDNPARGLAPFTRETVRGRSLDMEEVVTIWRAAGDLGHPFATAFRLLILTAAQRDQVGGLRVSEFRRDHDSHALIRSPTGQTVVDGGPLQITLPPTAQSLVEAALPARRAGGDSTICEHHFRSWRRVMQGFHRMRRPTVSGPLN